MTHDAKNRMIKKRPYPLIILITLLLAVAAYLGWLKYGEKRPPVIPVSTEQEQPIQPGIPPEQVTEPTLETQIPSETPPTEVAPKPEVKEDPCMIVSEKILQYFDYLNKQEYIAERNLEGGIHGQATKLINKLFANPPVVVGETENLYTVLNNTAHFYRILGKDNVFLIKDFLDREAINIESTTALFYQWSTIWEQCDQSGVSIRLPLKDLYEYAGFFLNTLGGQSYLFRRQSNIRMLAKYYAILILDQANDKSINSHGLDIRPHINSLLAEMSSTDLLVERDEYIAKLLAFQDKYQAQYGIDVTVPSAK